MKKNYILLLLLVAFGLQLNAQTACSVGNDAPVSSIVYTNPENNNQNVAFDFPVDAYTQFALTSITVKMATADLATLNPTGDITVYSEVGGIPGTVVSSETITPTVVTETPISTFAIYTVTFTFTTPVVLDNTAGATVANYWIGFVMGNTVNGDTGVTAGALVAGQAYASKSDTTAGVWAVTTTAPLLDGTYTFTGTCLLLGVEEFSLNDVSISPNPSKDFINIKMNNPKSIEKVEVFDITGKRVLNFNNTTKINITNLGNGVYMLRVQTDKGSVTKKIIKN
ncbi:T9SS type A sorting domain-containing protein [Lacinutrix sp. Bg11-31]|uniref:T9SS type A sorting domain-containing protein n=1 Tax=Lacinutrix sp. Bg11-31 TaxID=2057808 RepID=UPI000C312EA0|nr:T9SS type A sorting domain-containing protein [Lacinutrix sp. Bg11-31]AUC81007.1 hypothetical protein CW733_02200 [Lacinutrix sp. Bg11-31]